MRSPTDASDGIRRAWRLACAREKIDPQKPERLPRLFALDAALLIAGGFVYQLDCLAAGQAGAGFCASHIGCAAAVRVIPAAPTVTAGWRRWRRRLRRRLGAAA